MLVCKISALVTFIGFSTYQLPCFPPVFSTPRSESQRFQSETCEVEKSLGWSVGRSLYLSGGIWGPMGSMGLIDYPSIFGEATTHMICQTGGYAGTAGLWKLSSALQEHPSSKNEPSNNQKTLHADSKSS